MNYLKELNNEQKRAVEHKDGSLLIIAGAGAGKTRVITYRILHLINNGIAPESILAVTFTNKAAKEMRERVHSLLSSEKDINRPVQMNGLPHVSTFHSLGVSILRENFRALEIPKHFTIFDRNDSIRSIRQSIKDAGYDTGQFEPKKILGTISKQKGDSVSFKEYEAKTGNEYYGQIVSEVWKKYEKILKDEKAFDFDDLLLKTAELLRDNDEVRNHYQNIWKYIHVDEYQDTNKVQNEIVKYLSGEDKNICVVGDVDQCLIGSTKITMADGSQKQIQNVKENDEVLSNYGSGDYRPARVTQSFSKSYNRDLIKINTTSGKTLTSTEEHVHFAEYKLDHTPQMYFVYLMYKKDIGFRIGTSKVYTKGQRKRVVGFKQRINQEHADALWILETYKTEQDARVSEYKLSLKYKIPTLPFISRKGGSINGYVHDQKILSEIFSSFDTQTSGEKILKDFNLDTAYPHHRPQSNNSNRRNLTITLCGDRRGKTPMHRLTMVGNDMYGKKLLINNGFSIRLAKKGSKSWRFEIVNKDFSKLQKDVVKIKELFPELVLCQKARLGKKKLGDTIGSNSLAFLPASSLRIGMALFNENGDYDTIKKIERIKAKQTKVYDINIENTHNFIANNIVTHNCIYTWRGAQVDNMMRFEKEYVDTTIVFLEENYRSTKTIIAASNRIIEKNNNRPEKNLFTNNEDGEKITLFNAYGEIDEAYFVAGKSKELIESGVSPKEIAVLYRANFQSRILEEAFLEAKVDYQVLGVRFFERKEIKDILSFIRLALNPSSATDMKRVINVPPRGIGKVTLLRIVSNKESECSPAMIQKINDFKEMLSEIGDSCKKLKPSEVIKFIIKRTGIEDHLINGDEEDKERLENIRELVTLAKKYDVLDTEEAMEKLMTDAALATDQDELSEDKEGVKLMTVHAAKGLEFDYVFVTGLEEGLFPHEGMGSGKIDTEEERRLFYVALTRARKKIFLSYTSVRTIFGAKHLNVPSEFITDIDEELMDGGECITTEPKMEFLNLDDL